MSLSMVQGDILKWRVNVTEDGAAKDISGATLSAAVKTKGQSYTLTAALAVGNTGVDVTVNTTTIPVSGGALLQCRIAKDGLARTAVTALEITPAAF